ncbi:hypothetical protein ACFWNF_16280 [Streptomyces anulatus]|uniref:hypothetical protein n=1 Tax=Streptomyces anulatus TaxID=1892 RepID=UPI003654874E
MTRPGEIARYRDETGRMWVLALADDDGEPRLRPIGRDGQRGASRSWFDVAAEHQLNPLYPPPAALD